MKAARLTKFGDNGIEILDVEKPQLSAGKILVEVYASSVNPFDWKVAFGAMQIPLPITLGGDFSGVVKEVGLNVSNFKIGDEVYGLANTFNGGSGSFAEYVLAPLKSLSKKPKNIDYVHAGALPLVGVSALQALEKHINLTKNQKILIHGGGGGIGGVAIQIAKNIGAYVATTVSTNDINYVKSLGPDKIINYETQKFEDLLSDFDAVFDTVGAMADTYKRSFKVLKKGGIILSMIEKPDEILMRQYQATSIAQASNVTGERLEKLRQMVESGIIKVNIDKIFPLDKTKDALLYLKNMHPKGKVVIAVK